MKVVAYISSRRRLKMISFSSTALKSLQKENSFDEDKLIIPDNGKCGGDWRSVGLRGVRSHSKVNVCEKLPVSNIRDCVIDPAATTLPVDTSIDFH